MKSMFLRSLAVAFLAVCSTVSLQAEIGSIDPVPAATLLLPYFEVSLDPSGNGKNTLFSINNAKPESTVVHITFWTQMARPSINFNIFLTGYDVQTYDLADLFVQGNIATTPVLPPGEFSAPNEVPPSCSFPLPPSLPPSLLTYLRNAHTGLPIPQGFQNAGLCAAPSPGQRSTTGLVAKGYITMDVVNDCSLLFPGEVGYFEDGGTGVASNNNAIWGDFYLLEAGGTVGHGDNLVHIEATDSVASGFWDSGDYTFYGRYNDFDARDNREPLATTWAARYFSGEAGPDTMATDFIAWRDSGLDDSQFFPCGDDPAPYPLATNPLFVWDEQESVVVLEGSPFPIPTPPEESPFPYAANRLDVAEAGSIFDSGWMRLNFDLQSGSAQDPLKQAYVRAIHHSPGQFTIGLQAIALDSALNKTFLVTTASEEQKPGPPER